MNTSIRAIRILGVLALLVLLPVASQAQTAPAFAVINIPQIMRDSTAAQSVRQQIDSKQKAFQAELSKKEDELQKDDQDLAKQRSVLAPDAFEKKLTAFRSKANEAQKEVRDKKASLDKAFGSAIGDIQKAVTDIVADLAKEKGFTMAVPSTELLYYDPSLDISAEVLTRLNKKLPSLSVKF